MDRAVAMHGGAAVAAGGQNRTKTKKPPPGRESLNDCDIRLLSMLILVYNFPKSTNMTLGQHDLFKF